MVFKVELSITYNSVKLFKQYKDEKFINCLDAIYFVLFLSTN